MSDKTKVAVVGIGWWSNVLADACGRAGTLEIVNCTTRSPEKRQAFAEKYGCRQADSYEAVLADPEVEGVILTTPHSIHSDQVVAAAEAGKHVFVEKPFTLTVAGAKRAIAAAGAAGVTLQIGHHRRKSGANRRIKAMLEAGDLGLVHRYEANLSVSSPMKDTWRNSRHEQPLGGLTGLGVHMIDNIHYLGGSIKRVYGMSKQILKRDNVDDITTVLCEMEAGPLAYITFSMVLPKECTTSVHGIEASAWSEEEGGRLFVQKKSEFSRNELEADGGDPLAEEMAEFANCVRTGVSPETGGAEGLAVAEVMEALIASQERDAPVEVGEFR